jgi:thiamine biosynthesis lipoprotein
VSAEASIGFTCFGGEAEVHAASEDAVVERARDTLRDIHARLSRFLPQSELTRLNRDPRASIPASELMLQFAGAVSYAGRLSGGLVDATRLDAIERAGYRESREGAEPLELRAALALAPQRQPARANPERSWERVEADVRRGRVVRPPGLRLDSGGIAKGLAADLVARDLSSCETFAVNCAGDLRIGGTGGVARRIRVEDPFGGGCVHELELVAGGVATSGIGRRSWVGADGLPAHHLIDPRTGRPAYTGVVQATAVAGMALEAEVRAKCAVLGGPGRATHWLGLGGVIVHDDGSAQVVEAHDVKAAA